MNDSPSGLDFETANPNPQVPWTQEQWDRVQRVVAAEAQQARVAAGFLPLYGPLSRDTDFVRTNLISTGGSVDGESSLGLGSTPQRLEIDDISTSRLWTLQVKVYLRGPQLADPEMTSVLALFRRAANVLARLEDTVVFNGLPKGKDVNDQLKALPPIWEILGRRTESPLSMPGLLPMSPEPYPGTYDPPHSDPGSSHYRRWSDDVPRPDGPDPYPVLGNSLVGAVSESIGNLEQNGHYGPFALVTGQELFRALQTPNNVSLVLPQDRVIPFLGAGGTLVRSTTLPPWQAVVVALGGEPVELVIAKDITVDFLQVTTDPVYVFRLHERLALRIKHPGAICGIKAEKPRDKASTAPTTTRSTAPKK